MEKFLFDPKAPGAFSSDVMHKVVLNGVDFELPDNIWDSIDDAFGNYWNVEVGYGGWPDLNSAVASISKWLKKEHIIFSTDKVVAIVNVMFDWIEQIPGATLDDDEVVVPHSWEEEEDMRRFIKDLEKKIREPRQDPSSDPDLYINDNCTNCVYISDKLKDFYPGTYKRLIRLFEEMEIAWGEAQGTKDIWIRDYMPIQLRDDYFLFYEYDPDYLKGKPQKYKMDMNDAHKVWRNIFNGKKGPHPGNLYYKLDGGNVVTIANYKVLTEKVFKENGKKLDDIEFLQYLESRLRGHIIILPWHCDNPEDPNADVYGHSDGLVKWTGGRHVLMSNHRDFDPKEADEIRRILEDAGFQVTEILFDVPNPNKDYNWAYINYLQVGKKIIVPTFGIQEDKQALKYIREANPDCVVRGFRMRNIALNGGALHCITWNIKI